MIQNGRGCILLVEDDPNDVLLIQRAFRNAKIINPIHTVGDGDAAVAYLAGTGDYADRAEHPLPVMLLLDLKLPRRSGHEVLAWLRQQPGIKRMPVVILTSSKETLDINRAYDLGANSYLVKPVAFDDLMHLVRTLDLYWCLYNERPDLNHGKGASAPPP